MEGKGKHGLLILFAGLWILVVQILVILEILNTEAPDLEVPLLLRSLVVHLLYSVAGCLGIIAGLRIYARENLKGRRLAVSAGVLGISMATLNTILLSLRFDYFHDLSMTFLFVGAIFLACSLPVLLLLAGIPKFRADLGRLIIGLSAFLVSGYLIYGLLYVIPSLLAHALPTFPSNVYMIVFFFSFLTGLVGIEAGRWIGQGLARGPSLAILTGVLYVLLVTIFNIAMAYDSISYYQGAELVFFYINMILNYAVASLYLAGGLVARTASR